MEINKLLEKAENHLQNIGLCDRGLADVFIQLIQTVRRLNGDLEDLLGPNYEPLRQENIRLKKSLEYAEVLCFCGDALHDEGDE